MPSFSRAIAVEFVRSSSDSSFVYSAVVDQDWSVFGTPHGGYLLSVLLNAINALQSKRKSPHGDPAHLTASFLRAAKPGKVEMELEVIKVGKKWTNVECRMVQNDQTVLLAQALYTSLPPLPSHAQPFSTSNQNLLPLTPSPYAPLTPFLTHPSQSSSSPQNRPNEKGRRWSSDSVLWFVPELMKWSEDEGVRKRREEGESGGRRGERGRKELEWGSWCEFVEEEDEITVASLPFFADLMSSIPELLPPPERVSPHYYPTLAMSLQFHVSLSSLSSSPYTSSLKIVGCWGTGQFIHEGRHEQRTEVWMAPGRIGEGEVKEGWREKCMCLVTANQIALSVPIEGMKTAVPKPKKEAKL